MNKVYVKVNGQTMGPYTTEQLKNWIAKGQLTGLENGWHEGLTAWQTLNEIISSNQANINSPNSYSSTEIPVPLDTQQETASDHTALQQTRTAKLSSMRATLNKLFTILFMVFLYGILGIGVLVIIVENYNKCIRNPIPNYSDSENAEQAVSQPAPTPPPETAPFDIQPIANLDQRQFLLYRLEDLYRDFCSINKDNPANDLASLRNKAHRMHDYIQLNHIDDTLEFLYSDFLTFVDGFSSFLVNIDKIQSDSQIVSGNQSSESASDAAKTGLNVAGQLLNLGAQQQMDIGMGESLFAGGAVALIQYFWDEQNKRESLDAARKQAISFKSGEQNRLCAETVARFQNRALALAQKSQWQKGEADFDDFAALQWNTLSRLVESRPHDPFLVYRLIEILLSQPPNSSSAEVNANACLSAARLVPAGQIYDEYRAQLLAVGGLILLRSLDNDGPYGSQAGPIPTQAEQFWKTCLQFDKQDSTGFIRWMLSQAYAANGRIAEGLALSSDVAYLQQQTKGFVYHHARLLSISGKQANAFKWLEHGIKNLGIEEIAYCKRDPNLAALRERMPKQFENLTAVKFNGAIDYGVFNDDILLTNYSCFPITGVEYTVTITKGDKEWKPVLKANRIMPGQGCKWENVVYIPGRQYDNVKQSLICDQNK
jgi:hypothetical protein